jgi:beta-lactamase regulating signal transducer with metallopeptidase domain
MNSLEVLLTKPLLQALGWALVHFIWQGALIALLYAGLATLLRHRAASLRYSVACAAMLLMLMLPVATVFIVERSLSLTSIESGGRAAQPVAAPSIVDNHRQALATESAPLRMSAYASQSVPAAQSQPGGEASADSASPAWPSWAKARITGLIPCLVALWFAGVLFLSLRFFGGLLVARRLKQMQTSPLLEHWQAKLAGLCEQLRVSRPVRLCESILVEVPTVIGWLRPVILMPTSALTGLSPAQLEALLAHELGHIKRYDYLVNLLQTAVETLLFYHPAVWWLSSQIRQEREHCCDDLAVATCGNMLIYARALAELEHLRGVAPRLAVAASGGVLLRRIQRLVGNPARPSHRFEPWLAGFIAMATAGCLLAGAQTATHSGEIKNADANAAKISEVVTPAVGVSPVRAARVADQKASDPAGDVVTQAVERPNDSAPESSNTAEQAVTSANNQSDQQSESGSGFSAALAAEGYANLSDDDLNALRTHGVTPAFIREMNALLNRKLSVDTLTAFRVHGVTPPFISELRAAGLNDLSADDLVAFRVHGVSPQVVAGWKAAGYDRLSADDLVAFQVHGVTAAFVEEMKGLGFNHLSPDDLTAFRIHGVSTAFVQTMRGYIRGNLTADDLTAMRIHGVTPEFIHEIEAVGYTNLSADDLVAFRIHGVSVNFIKSIQALGFKPSADQLVELRIHGVTPEYIESVRSRGFRNATLEQLIELRRLNITPGQRKQ